MIKNDFNNMIIQDAINRIEECCAELTTMVMTMPTLHIISTSNYIGDEVNIASKFGMEAIKHIVTPQNIMIKLTELSKDLNNKIVIELPLEDEIDYPRLSEMMDLLHPMQDVLGFKVPLVDISSMYDGNDFITHPTFSPIAKSTLLLNMLVDADIKGKEVAIVGNDLASGLPISMMYNQLGATVHNINKSTNIEAKFNAFSDVDTIISTTGTDMTVYDELYLYEDKICINASEKLIDDLSYDAISNKSKFINKANGSMDHLIPLFIIYNCLASQMTNELVMYNDKLKRCENDVL